ncbi:MAG: hypothetical protein JWM34_3798 [Ilumatobacteraceae bacterium]|nr:hypothetical protein [Ilumatobacteraceae bacterium]
MEALLADDVHYTDTDAPGPSGTGPRWCGSSG